MKHIKIKLIKKMKTYFIKYNISIYMKQSIQLLSRWMKRREKNYNWNNI